MSEWSDLIWIYWINIKKLGCYSFTNDTFRAISHQSHNEKSESVMS